MQRVDRRRIEHIASSDLSRIHLTHLLCQDGLERDEVPDVVNLRRAVKFVENEQGAFARGWPTATFSLPIFDRFEDAGFRMNVEPIATPLRADRSQVAVTDAVRHALDQESVHFDIVEHVVAHVLLHRAAQSQIRRDLAPDFIPRLADPAAEKANEWREIFVEGLAPTTFFPRTPHTLHARQGGLIGIVLVEAHAPVAARVLDSRVAGARALDDDFGHVTTHDGLLSI
ncbi:MAG: hypothetical protein WD768_15995 [Phycisphaeraceae bacterium]